MFFSYVRSIPVVPAKSLEEVIPDTDFMTDSENPNKYWTRKWKQLLHVISDSCFSCCCKAINLQNACNWSKRAILYSPGIRWPLCSELVQGVWGLGSIVFLWWTIVKKIVKTIVKIFLGERAFIEQKESHVLDGSRSTWSEMQVIISNALN